MKEAFFVSPDYIKQYGLPTSPNELQQHKLIQYRFITSNQLVPVLLNDNGQTVTVEMPNALIVNDTSLMVDAALKGLGIGRIVEPLVTELIDSGQLVPVLPEYWYPYSALYVYFHQDAQKAKRVRVLIDFLLEKLMPPAERKA
ncbi:LysR substrate-binding domain-containing protein [Thalassotalea euphylliae]|nr:LysR substrate-binding domain-containing protein [Thalassotalea euphylliae]